MCPTKISATYFLRFIKYQHHKKRENEAKETLLLKLTPPQNLRQDSKLNSYSCGTNHLASITNNASQNFLVADTRLHKLLFGPLVGRSVRPSVRPSQGRFLRSSAPAHPSATSAAVYTTFFKPPAIHLSIHPFLLHPI